MKKRLLAGREALWFRSHHRGSRGVTTFLLWAEESPPAHLRGSVRLSPDGNTLIALLLEKHRAQDFVAPESLDLIFKKYVFY